MKKKKRYQTAAFKRKLKAQLRMIGKNLRAIRQANNASQKTVAKIAGISASYLSRIERGLAPQFKIIVIWVICKHYNEEVQEVVTKGFKPTPRNPNIPTTKTATR